MKIASWLLLTLLVGSCNEKKALITGLEGENLPEFSLILPDSVSYFNIQNIPRNEKLLLCYFSSTCPYCRAQMTELMEQPEDIKNTRICIITGYSFSSMKKFHSDFKIYRRKELICGYDYQQHFLKYFKPTAVPFFAIYGTDRKLQKVYQGKLSTSQLRKLAGY